MARRCTICSHPERDKADLALLRGTPYRDIATRFGVSPSAVHRHTGHIRRGLTAVAEQDPQAYGEGVLGQVQRLTERALRILDRAERAADLRTAAGAIREARGCLELVARLEGQVADTQTHLHAHAHLGLQELPDLSGLPEEHVRGLREAARWLILNGRAANAANEAEVPQS